MRGLEFKVNIIGLSQKAHHFDFEIGDEFFEVYGRSLVEKGHFRADVTLDKRETMIEGHFHISGAASLVCDRSLEPFDRPMEINKTILFKYGPEEKELSDEIVMITRTQATLDIGQYIYELIVVEVPIKKLHPKFKDDKMEESDIQLVYSSPADANETEEDHIDPRWDKLKKLK
jgi:uncharacterized protein